MNRVNYQKELEVLLAELNGKRGENSQPLRPTLLLHSCCAPCSSYVLEYLREYFAITVLYYNPNITDGEEYERRVREQQRLIDEMNAQACADSTGEGTPGIRLVKGTYEPECFFREAKGLETVPEGGERCFRCYELRLRETARLARLGGFDYFTTTLTISPLKNAQKLNEIGQRVGAEYGAAFLPSDFKKNNGYRRSVELSAQYGLYRQDYCGCVFSRAERERQKAEKQTDKQV